MPDLRPTERFSDRVADYVKYRPTYPEGIVDLAIRECGLRPDSLIADIGCGPGNLARLFVEDGYQVVGVEPNEPMRLAGDELFASFPNFTSVAATAEATALDDGSVDLITAGQAFHWFRPDETRAEFRRILKPGGWVMLVWNDRNMDAGRLSREYERILREMAPDYENVRHAHSGEDAIEAFFEHPPKKATFSNFQEFDRKGFLGRATSSSYVPQRGHPGHDTIVAALDKLFEEEQKEGRVRFEYDTQVYYDRL